MSDWRIAVAHAAGDSVRAVYDDLLGARCRIAYVHGAAPGDRTKALAEAHVLITINLREEIAPDERRLLGGLRLVQQLTAGVDHVPFATLPAGVPVAGNAGVFAAPMAEHVVAMMLAAAKRLAVEDRAMRRGEFNQSAPNRMLAGEVCAILGLGGVGRAVARLVRALGMKVHAVNRTGVADEPVEFLGTLADLEAVLRPAAVVVLSLALTRATEGLIGARELAWTRDDVILVNVARGELIDQGALYRHLLARPRSTACLDAWWVEPIRHGEFRLEHPFLELPNVIASPHNSAVVPGSLPAAARRAAENVRRLIDGRAPLRLVTDEEKLR